MQSSTNRHCITASIGSHRTLHFVVVVVVVVVVVDRFYIALFSSLEQAHCVRMSF